MVKPKTWSQSYNKNIDLKKHCIILKYFDYFNRGDIKKMILDEVTHRQGIKK